MTSLPKTIAVSILLIILLMLGLGDSALAADRQQAERLSQAEALSNRAREALNRSRYEEAAKLFAEAFDLAKPEMEAGDALYWEAFARSRLSGVQELKHAAKVLQLQQQEYYEAATAREGEALAARITAQLAELGEVQAVREITAQASEEQIRQETRTAALQALMQMDPRKALPILQKIIQDDRPENRELRRHSIFIMCQHGGDETEDLLIDLLRKETDPEFLSEIVMCLSMNGSDKALQALMDVFRTTDDPRVSEATLISIGQHGSDQVFGFLAEIAQDKSRKSETRAQALMALGMTQRDRKVAQILIGILETETDPMILQMTLVTLSRLEDPAAAAAIMNLATRPGVDEEMRTMALHFATMNGGLDLGTLRQLYQDAQSRDLKQQICHVLTRVEDQDAALDLLIEITRTETDPEIKRDAVFWIGQFDSEKAADYLLEVINQQ